MADMSNSSYFYFPQPNPPPPIGPPTAAATTTTTTNNSSSRFDYFLPPPPIPGVAVEGGPTPPPPYHHYHHSHPEFLPPPHPQYSLPSYPHPLPHPPQPQSQPLLLDSESNEELRTLFVAGLPDDVKPREIYNLFREFPGFRSSQLRSAASARAYAFAVFADQQSAVTAMQSLNGQLFDVEKESTLYINLAKSNSRSKHSRTGDSDSYSPDKKLRRSGEYSRNFLDSGVGSNIHMPAMGNSAYSINGYPSTQSHSIYDYGSTDPNKPLNNSSASYVPQDNHPCPTLFVAKLGPTCSETELNAVFSKCPGFLALKMQKKNGLPVAFVDFKDVASSTGALNSLQGTLLQSSIEGMRLEYAKSRMGQQGRRRR